MTDAFATASRDLPWLRALAARLARGDTDVADDLVQETLEQAWRTGPAGGELAAPRGWLATVLRSRLRMTLRAGARRSARESATHAAVPSTQDPTDELARLELLGIVVECLHALPELDRRIVMLRYFDDLDATGIGARLAMAPPTVRSRLHRAITRLRDDMDARCGGRCAWALLLGAPLRQAPVTSSASLVAAVTAMSTVTKLAVVLAVVATVTAVWISGRGGTSLATTTTTTTAAPGVTPSAREHARESGDRSGTHAARLAAVLRARAPLHATPPRSPLPVPEIGAVDAAALVKEGKTALNDAFEACLLDVAPHGPPVVIPGAKFLPGHTPMPPLPGRVVIRGTMIGSPGVGAVFESVSVVEATEPRGPLVECIIESAYAYAGPAPAGELEAPVMMAWLGEPPADLDEDQWRVQMFEALMLAYVPESVHACDPEVAVEGALRFDLEFADGAAPTAARVDGPDLPLDVVACVRTAAARWKFPRKFAGRTMSYVATLPLEPRPTQDPDVDP